MRIAASIEQLKETLNSLIGKPLSATTVTKGDQSCISLDFGRMVCEKEGAEEESLDGEKKQDETAVRIRPDGIRSVSWGSVRPEGELTLMAWCNWRIEMGESQIVCGSQDSAEEGKPIQSGIREMIGDTVADVSLDSFFDLLVSFSSGRRLRLFCDQSRHENDDDSYQLVTAGGEAYGVIAGLIERVDYEGTGAKPRIE